MSDRRRNALLGVIFGYASITVALLRNVLFVPIYLHSIPLAEYGAWLATGGALALILISDFGLSGVVTQKISTSFGAGDVKALGSLAGSALVIGALMALLLTLMSLACVPLLPGLSTLTDFQRTAVVDCFLMAIAANAVGIVGATAISVIRSLQMSVLAGFIVLAADMANIGVTLFGLFTGKGLYAIAMGVLVRSVIVGVAALAGVGLIYSRTLNAKLVVHWRAVRDLFEDSSRLFLSSVAMKIQSQASVFFVSSILGPTSAAIYSLTVRAHETVLMLIGQINAALVPSVTHLLGSGNLARFRAVVLRLLLMLVVVTAFTMTTTVVLNSGFLRLWLGKRMFGGQGLSILMAAALFVSSVGFVAYDALLALGRFRLVSNVFVLTSSLQVALLVGLLSWGFWVAPVVILVTAFLWGGIFWINVSSEIDLSASEVRTLLAELARIIAVSVAVAAGLFVFYPAVNSWVALIVEGSICVALLAGGYLIASARVRDLAREEIGVTIRSLRVAGG